MLRKQNKNKKGFTIIELLVVISIIGLLATISVVVLNGARRKSRDTKRISDIRQINTALEMYYNDRYSYPADTQFSSVLGTSYGSALCYEGFVLNTSYCTTTGKIYLGVVPGNPAPGGVSYVYKQLSSGMDYQISFLLEENLEGLLKTDPHYGTPYGIK